MTNKKTIAIALFLSVLGFRTMTAQTGSSVVLEGSQVFASFRFVDAQGTVDNAFSNRVGAAFNIGYQYTWKMGLIGGAAVGIYNGGATKKYGDIGYSWNLQYERAKLDLGYIYDKFWIMPYVIASPYYGYMLKGSETTGTGTYDLKKSSDMSTSDYGVVGTGGVRVPLSDYIKAFAAYNYNFGLMNIENSGDQKLYNRGFSVSLGIAICFPDNRSNPRIQ
jgi:hypothetical protein